MVKKKTDRHLSAWACERFDTTWLFNWKKPYEIKYFIAVTNQTQMFNKVHISNNEEA